MVGLNKVISNDDTADLNTTPNAEIIVANDTDTDDELHEYTGYEPLPINDFEGDSEDSSDENASGENVNTNENASFPEITPMEQSLIKEVWDQTKSTPVDIKMDNKKVDEVKQAMANITLPPSAFPEWANSIAEDQWKEHLLSRLEKLPKLK